MPNHPPQPIQINGQRVTYGNVPYIIAEAGVNHNGKIGLAYKLIDAAARAGADAVKFQTFKAKQVVIPAGKMAPYQQKNLKKRTSQMQMLKKLELPENFYPKLIAHCKKRGITFLSTPHGGIQSLNFLAKLRIPAFKFGSGDLTNLPLLKAAASFRKPMVIGTGMATLKEVQDAIQAISRAGNNKIVALHCTTNYPCPTEEVNLRSMQTMIRSLPVLVGYSDHTLGGEVSFAAACLGACLIEKHLTLDRNLPGPDHRASAEPNELKNLVTQLRQVPIFLGSAEKGPNRSERSMRRLARKSIVSLQAIHKGDRFTEKTLGIKRPGTGLPPKLFPSILGKRARKNIPEHHLLHRSDYA